VIRTKVLIKTEPFLPNRVIGTHDTRHIGNKELLLKEIALPSSGRKPMTISIPLFAFLRLFPRQAAAPGLAQGRYRRGPGSSTLACASSGCTVTFDSTSQMKAGIVLFLIASSSGSLPSRNAPGAFTLQRLGMRSDLYVCPWRMRPGASRLPVGLRHCAAPEKPHDPCAIADLRS
jgi:hypothetical protein